MILIAMCFQSVMRFTATPFLAPFLKSTPETLEFSALVPRLPTGTGEASGGRRGSASRGRSLDHQHVESERPVRLDGEMRLGLR